MLFAYSDFLHLHISLLFSFSLPVPEESREIGARIYARAIRYAHTHTLGAFIPPSVLSLNEHRALHLSLYNNTIKVHAEPNHFVERARPATFVNTI